jgi:Protein of unknown function (DUF2845)
MITRSIAFFLLLFPVASVAEGDTFQCGKKLVTVGDTSAEVAAKCGSPTRVAWVNGQQNQPSVTIDVSVETWLYNFGPNRLMMRVHIEGGTVVEIDSVGYGYIVNR